jgi:TetR/AcrR family transcriptional repressor of nem operon
MPQVLSQSYNQLVEKAQELFWTRGYKGVKAKELASCLDVSTSVIYNKFTKDMLFMDSLGYYTANYSDPFLKQLRETTEGLDSLRYFFYALIDALLDKTFPKSCLMVNTVVEMRNANQEITEVYQRYFETLTNSYKVVLDKAIGLGQIKHPEKKDEYAEFLLGVIFSMSILYKIQPKEQLREFIDEQLSFIE